MSAALDAIGRWCFRHKMTVIGAWVAVLALMGGGAVLWQGPFNNDFQIPSSRSQAALEKLRMTFPQGAGLSALAVIEVPEGHRVEDHRVAIEGAVVDFQELSVVDTATSAWNEFVEGLISDNGRAAIIELRLAHEGNAPSDEDLTSITEVAHQLRNQLPGGTQVVMGGEAYSSELPHLSIIEAIGVGVAFIVLTVVLGSLVAAGLPLLTAITGVGIAMAIMVLLANVFAVNSTTPLLSVMLGLAVGIDYALFILSRHRDQLRQGLDPEESAGRAVGTAGSAVVFAGLTVFIALLGLGVAQIPFLATMGIFAALTVVFSVLIALTMLPALMGLLGTKMRPKLGKPKKDRPKRSGVFAWWVGMTTQHPIVSIVTVGLLLGALTIPAAGLRVALPNAGQQPSTDSARIAYDLLAENYGAGINGPLIVTADIISSSDPLGLVASLKSDIESVAGVARVPLATPNPNADTALIQVVPTTAPDDPATAVLVRALQDRHDDWKVKYGVDTAVTGITAVAIDVSDKLTQALLPFGVLVVGLSLVLLAAVFRSVWVPIKATLGYLLSVGAAFGATTLVFNHGVLKEMINLERAMPVISFLPILLMGILFGLAMDYEVFLVSRIREEYVHGAEPVDAVRKGFIASGPVVAAAAIIMFVVFAFFVPEGIGPLKAIAFALAVGVAVDAFLVRMTVVPAVLALLGHRAWWLPKWLDNALPSFDVEGETHTRQMALKDWPGDESVLFAEDLAVEGVIAPLTMRLNPGHLVGLIGPATPRRGVALALSGRLIATSGKARVAGVLLPGSASLLRRQVAYVDLGQVAHVATALDGVDGTVTFIDTVTAISGPAERTAFNRLLERVRERGAVVLCAADESHLDVYCLDDVVTLKPVEAFA